MNKAIERVRVTSPEETDEVHIKRPTDTRYMCWSSFENMNDFYPLDEVGDINASDMCAKCLGIAIKQMTAGSINELLASLGKLPEKEMGMAEKYIEGKLRKGR